MLIGHWLHCTVYRMHVHRKGKQLYSPIATHEVHESFCYTTSLDKALRNSDESFCNV